MVLNAKTFYLSNFKYYRGPNPDWQQAAIAFDFLVIPTATPLPVAAYLKVIGVVFPELKASEMANYGDLLSQLLRCASKLEMDLHLNQVSYQPGPDCDRIAIACLHYPTTWGIITVVWQWLEAITVGDDFDFALKIQEVQAIFRHSVYGDPTVYALIRTAVDLNIPSFFLWDEGLMQYGYGKYHQRSLSTIFSTDSLLDSDLTTQKDDCKSLLANLGFPVPLGEIVESLEVALTTAKVIGYPVAIKPVAGHEGIGVTAAIQDPASLVFAWEKAQEAITEGSRAIIIEQSLTGSDFRLLCVGQKFIAALERRPPYVIGDGLTTIEDLIAQENQTLARQDTPTSSLAKIRVDPRLENYLQEQGLNLRTVLEKNRLVYLGKVANISAGGVSIDATELIHPDNCELAEQIAQYLNLACLGIDVIAADISKSWREGNFGIIEINASPGIFMHLKPAIGKSIDVPRQIFNFLFPPNQPCRIPIITFNRLSQVEIERIINYLPGKLIWGLVSQQGVWLNGNPRIMQTEYYLNIQSLLRHPQLDLLIAEYPEAIFQEEGLFYEASDLVILSEPTEIELMLGKYLLPQGQVICHQDGQIWQQTAAAKTRTVIYSCQDWADLYLAAIASLCSQD